MIMVDSSLWIDYFNGVDNKQTDTLNGTLEIRPVAVGDLILTGGSARFQGGQRL